GEWLGKCGLLDGVVGVLGGDGRARRLRRLPGGRPTAAPDNTQRGGSSRRQRFQADHVIPPLLARAPSGFVSVFPSAGSRCQSLCSEYPFVNQLVVAAP